MVSSATQNKPEFADLLKSSGTSVTSLLKQSNIHTQEDLKKSISDLTSALKSQPELSGLGSNESLFLTIQDGRMSVSTSSGKCVCLQSESEASRIAGLIHQFSRIDAQATACPGTSLSLLAKNIEKHPHFNARVPLIASAS
ncbi:MAG: hypothetical protein A2007_04110 [Verrucomicrobia bacterium GWC2_42_7]|nr:MAG: hypothetical protein A2007_04110 [Verrucomicrobia bacterium GWC2_42_7]